MLRKEDIHLPARGAYCRGAIYGEFLAEGDPMIDIDVCAVPASVSKRYLA